MQITREGVNSFKGRAGRSVGIIFSLFILFFIITGMHQVGAAAVCNQGVEVRIWSAPLNAQPGEKLEVIAVATDGELTELLITDPTGRQKKLPVVQGGGPPWSLRGVVTGTNRGRYRIDALRGGRTVSCSEVQVGASATERVAREWDLPTQAFYAAWIETLFDAPAEESLSFPSLEPVLRNPARNFLYDYLTKGEDLLFSATPDCADLSFFLHAYFAWKIGLPVSYRACDRGSAKSPPRCDPAEINATFVGKISSAATFRQVSRRIMDRVTSGGGRTALNSDASDFYPVPLSREALWPGTVYADPYGHTLILCKWIPQTEKRSGLLLAIDAQPDNSVARKRFWEGSFLFAQTPSAGPGFKAYRPPLRSSQGGWRPVLNSALNDRAPLPGYSLDQEQLSAEDFYARMEKLINPRGLNPEEAYNATLEALMEQLNTRVQSVDNGEEYMRSHPRQVVPMPRGPAIFETTGPWEDFATPSRDMRLLIALKVLADLPGRIRRHPELYVLRRESPERAAVRIEKLHTQKIKESFITYTRSDGSPWRLTLADIYARRTGLEVAYNPNDCVERRWGSSPGLADYASCRRQSPPEQSARMEEYRPWFRDARRPPR